MTDESDGVLTWPAPARDAGETQPVQHTVLEREVKLSVPDLDVVRVRLQDLQAASTTARFVGTTHERNTVLDTPQDDLRARDERLRIREIVERPGVQVTWKGPASTKGGVRRREEREFHADDSGACIAVLSNLGLRPVRSYQKVRASWALDGVIVCLDSLPFGTFVEIEFTAATDEQQEEIVLERTIALLGLEDAPRVQASYARLQQEWDGQNGLGTSKKRRQ